MTCSTLAKLRKDNLLLKHALTQIAEWNSLSQNHIAKVGSDGETHFYRQLAWNALNQSNNSDNANENNKTS